MFELDPEIVIYDAEYTTWEGALERNWSGPGEYAEVVEIGALRAETGNFTELDSLVLFVKPVKNPALSEYFMRLTGITQETVDANGMGFGGALEKFYAWAGELSLYSWGGDDRVMKENAELLGVPFPFLPEKLRDIRGIFRNNGVATEKYMSSTIPSAFGAVPPPRAHDALNDARSILEGLRLLKKRIKSKDV